MKKKQSKRKRIPSLDPATLELAIQELRATKLPASAKAQIEQMIRAASNPDSESPEAVILTLPKDRQKNIKAIAEDVEAWHADIAERGKRDLLALDDAEWQRLLDEADNEPPDATR